MNKRKIAIVSTHPIQYYAPLFMLLAKEPTLAIKTFYTKALGKTHFDQGFNSAIEWDIPLLEGYEYVFQPGGSTIRNKELRNTIQAWEPDIILVFGWNFPGHLSIMRHFKGKTPVWFRGDSNLLGEKKGWRKILRRLFLRWVYRYIDRALYVGTENREYYLKHGVQDSQLSFVPHAIDNTRFQDTPTNSYEEEAQAWRLELGIHSTDFVVLFAGKLEPIKNPGLLLRAVQHLNSQVLTNKFFKLLFVGTGVLERSLKETSKNDPNVFFLGFQNQSKMPVVYRLGNILCLPSLSETWGLAVNEAMSCSRPVIVSKKVGCAVDLVQEGKTGFLFHNEQELKEKLELASQENLHNLGFNAFQHIQAWDFNTQVKMISALTIES